MMPRLDPAREAQRLHAERMAFEAAVRTGKTVPEARWEMAKARWAARDQQRARCGTEAAPAPTPIPDEEDDAEKGLMWWQKL